MQMIVALIRPNKWAAVQEALEQIEVERMTVADAIGFADSFSAGQHSHGVRSFPQVLSQVVSIEIIVNDDFLEKTIDMILRVGRTGMDGQSGDGKIFVLPVLNVVRALDGFSGKGAV